jgi:hypothetical protein
MILNSHSLRIIDASQKTPSSPYPHRKQPPQTLIGKDIKQYAASKIKSYMQKEENFLPPSIIFNDIQIQH